MQSDKPATLDQARARMARLAVNLQRILPPIDVASLLIGAAIAVLENTLGRAKARDYVAELASELDLARKDGLQ